MFHRFCSDPHVKLLHDLCLDWGEIGRVGEELGLELNVCLML